MPSHSQASSSSVSVSGLLRSSWQALRDNASTFLVGVVAVSILYALAAYVISNNVQQSVTMNLQGLGMDPARFEELSKRMQEGDETAYEEMMVDINKLTQEVEGMDETTKQAYLEQKMANMFGMVFPRLIALLVFSVILIAFANAYYLVVTLEDHKDAVVAAKRAAAVFIPLFGLWLWMLARSFAWIGFLSFFPPLTMLAPLLFIAGFVMVIVFGPRLVLAPVIYLRKGTDIMGSVADSIRLSKGHWGSIVINGISVLLVTVLFQVLAMMVARSVGSASTMLSMFLSIVVQQLAMVYMTIFFAKMAIAIIENPRKVQ